MTYVDDKDDLERIHEIPSPSWWITVAVVSEISGIVSECVESLQGHRVTLSQQQVVIKSLLKSLERMAFVEEMPCRFCSR